MLFTEFNINDAKKVWKEDGFIEGMIKTAKKLLKKGLPIEEIAEITDLPQADIIERNVVGDNFILTIYTCLSHEQRALEHCSYRRRYAGK